MTASVLAVFMLLPVLLQLGVPLVTKRRIVTGERAADLIVSGWVFSVLTLVPGVAAAAVLQWTVFSGLSKHELVPFYLLATSIPCIVANHISQHVLMAFEQYLRTAIVAMSQAGFAFLIIVTTFLVGHLTVATVLYATLGSYVGSFVLGWWFTRNLAGGGRVLHVRALLREGWTLVGGQIAVAAARRGDQAIALPALGAAVAGQYSVAVTVSALVFPVLQTFGNAKFHLLARDASDQATRKAVRETIVLAGAGAGGLAAVSPVLIPVFFGAQFAASVDILFIAVIGSALTGLGHVLVQALAARLQGRRATVAQCVGLACSLSAFFPLAHEFGGQGAAFAMVLGAAITVALELGSLQVRARDLVPNLQDVGDALRGFFRSAE